MPDHQQQQHQQQQQQQRNEPINLLRGWPNPSLLPTPLLRSAAHTTLSNPTIATAACLYGPDPGYEPAREAIAKWLTEFYRPETSSRLDRNKKQADLYCGGPVTASRICITGGASQNLGAMLGVYTDPEYTRRIWIVAPAYMLAFRIFEDAGFGSKLRSVPEDEGGIDLGYLRREMEKSEREGREGGVKRPRYKPDRKWAKVYRHVVYCVPTFSNPSGRTMSLERRRGLVRLAREFDVLVIPDDVYDFLQWPARQPGLARASEVDRHEGTEAVGTARLPRRVDRDRALDGGAERAGADGFGNACSNGSFSKIAGPGLRVGWVEGSERFAFGVSQT